MKTFKLAKFPTLTAGMVYDLFYECRDIGYGIETNDIRAYWTGEIDTWGKLTICPVDGSNTLYLFRDEITSADKAVR